MAHGGVYATTLRLLRHALPGEWLRTTVYLYGIHGTRKALRKALNAFYRMDHVYDVCQEFAGTYEGKFSILEFGVANGYAFTKKLYATRYLGLEDRTAVHGFDTFEGLPPMENRFDGSMVDGNEWVEGAYSGNYGRLVQYCGRKYHNFHLHKGLFQDTLTDDLMKGFEEWKPILIWIDCDYYLSTRAVFERLLPYIPTGCVIYFDDIDYNFGSRFTGEMRAVWEINQGRFGEEVELVLDRDLSWDSSRVYRLINPNSRSRFVARQAMAHRARPLSDDSPLP